jgi:hypothetical protein
MWRGLILVSNIAQMRWRLPMVTFGSWESASLMTNSVMSLIILHTARNAVEVEIIDSTIL